MHNKNKGGWAAKEGLRKEGRIFEGLIKSNYFPGLIETQGLEGISELLVLK